MNYLKMALWLGLPVLAGLMVAETFDPVEYVSPTRSEAPLPAQHLKTPAYVRGIYMSSWVAGTPSLRKGLISFIDDSELNSVVIDVKDYTGQVSFLVSDAKLLAAGYGENRISDLAGLIGELHSKNIYVIGRISVFQDPILARSRPELAIKKKSGVLWEDKKGLAWIDPAAKDAWEYTVLVGREAERAGFDELNFDYIRFASDGDLSSMVYPFWDQKTPKAEVMEEFFKYLSAQLESSEVPISADIFGLTTWNTDDLNIGQVLETAARHFDYVSPMVYPSHYPPEFQGYKNPADHPYEIIKTAMDRARERLVVMGTDPKKLRPWIQDFDLGADYDVSMVKLEKQAVYDAGLESWLSWDPANRYNREAYHRGL